MPKRSSKPRQDANEAAYDAVSRLTGGDQPLTPREARKAAAVILGSMGGKKGGPARAKSLSAKARSSIAKKAAQARWHKKG